MLPVQYEYKQSLVLWGGCSDSNKSQGPVVQSVVSLTSSLRVISLTVLADSIYIILIFFAEKMYSHFFSKKFQHICVSLDVNFNEPLTNEVVSFEQLGPERIAFGNKGHTKSRKSETRFDSVSSYATL